jgi:hypothetical protein
MRNGNIISPDKTEYTFLAGEEEYILFGERSFISHIRWQPRKLRHMNGDKDAGIYSINHDPDLVILYYLRYNSEFAYIYIKEELSKKGYSFEDCISFRFFDTKSAFFGYYRANIEDLKTVIGIENDVDIKSFLENLKNGEIFVDEYYINFLRNPFDAKAGNDGFIGYIYGFFQNIPYIAFPGTVWTKEDGLYYLVIDRRIFTISIDWLRKLGYNE